MKRRCGIGLDPAEIDDDISSISSKLERLENLGKRRKRSAIIDTGDTGS